MRGAIDPHVERFVAERAFILRDCRRARRALGLHAQQIAHGERAGPAHAGGCVGERALFSRAWSTHRVRFVLGGAKHSSPEYSCNLDIGFSNREDSRRSSKTVSLAFKAGSG